MDSEPSAFDTSERLPERRDAVAVPLAGSVVPFLPMPDREGPAKRDNWPLGLGENSPAARTVYSPTVYRQPSRKESEHGGRRKSSSSPRNFLRSGGATPAEVVGMSDVRVIGVASRCPCFIAFHTDRYSFPCSFVRAHERLDVFLRRPFHIDDQPAPRVVRGDTA